MENQAPISRPDKQRPSLSTRINELKRARDAWTRPDRSFAESRSDELEWCFMLPFWAVFTQASDESVPKLESSIHLFSGELVLFRREKSVKGNWYLRVKDKNGKYVIKTTKTSDIDVARAEAQKFYYETRALISVGIDINSPTVEAAYKTWVNEYWRHRANTTNNNKISEEVKKTSRFSTIEFQFRRYIIPFMGRINVSSVNSSTIAEYVRWRAAYYEKRPEEITQLTKTIPSETSIKMELSGVRQLLKFCMVRGWIRNIPVIHIPRGAVSLNPSRTRSGISSAELSNLVFYKENRYKIDGYGPKLSKRHLIQRDIVVNLLVFAAHTALRSGECLNLKWSNISIGKNEDEDSYVKIEVIDGKTGGRVVVARHGVEFAIKELYKLTGKFNGYVFCDPNSGNRLENPNHTINKLFNEIGIKDRKIVLYDARHLGITEFLLANNDIYVVSLNCGTSVHYIQKTYSKVLAVQKAKELAKAKIMGKVVKNAGSVTDKVLGQIIKTE